MKSSVEHANILRIIQTPVFFRYDHEILLKVYTGKIIYQYICIFSIRPWNSSMLHISNWLFISAKIQRRYYVCLSLNLVFHLLRQQWLSSVRLFLGRFTANRPEVHFYRIHGLYQRKGILLFTPPFLAHGCRGEIFIM